ncbi:hypothetical protein H9P43_004743 [Blastocladiella emersonii ATCC 22665]|nr:hypothetical protein H9P43_004743 [Blastocladiella emersonii ATCC 22665]
MALFPTTPHDISVYAVTQHLAVCPAPVSIVSDDWHWRMGLSSAAAFAPAVSSSSSMFPPPPSPPPPARDPLAAAAASPICLGGGRHAGARLAESLAARKQQQTAPAPALPRYRYLTPPAIAWLDPSSLIPHEPTSPAHLARLVEYLRSLDAAALLPTIIVTRTAPHVILDGHHRWQASLALGIPRVPCWVVDDTEADAPGNPPALLPVPASQFLNASRIHTLSNGAGVAGAYTDAYEYYRVRVYDTRNFSVLRIRDIAARARAAWAAHRADPVAAVGFGVKGTKHVAIRVPGAAGAPAVPADALEGEEEAEEEVRLEKVAPLVEWGLWRRAGESYTVPAPGGESADVARARPSLPLGEAGVSLVGSRAAAAAAAS